eukprot:754916-Hanusia_phi.AAC.1
MCMPISLPCCRITHSLQVLVPDPKLPRYTLHELSTSDHLFDLGPSCCHPSQALTSSPQRIGA